MYLVFIPVGINDNKAITFTIKPNQSLSSIIDDLNKEGLLQSKAVFYGYVRFFKYNKTFVAGMVDLSKNMNMADIAKALSQGKSPEIKITFPEGLTITQMADTLDKNDFISREDFLDCIDTCTFEYDFLQDGKVKEGYLFPDTYFFSTNNLDANSIIIKMLENFIVKIDTLNIKNGIEILGKYRTLDEIINMASMIERESFDNDERYIISGILWKRLDEGITLGVDATVRYIVNKPKEPLTIDDLNIKSKYNTRKYIGLPPTSISNPGIDAIDASVHPRKTDYYYYLHGDDGHIYFAHTLKEHNENIKNYIK